MKKRPGIDELKQEYQQAVDRFNDVLINGNKAISDYDLGMGYDAEFYLKKVTLLANHIHYFKQELIKIYESNPLAFADDLKLLINTREVPEKIVVPDVDISYRFRKPEGKDLKELLGIGDTIKSNYSEQVYKVAEINGPYFDYMHNQKIKVPAHYSLGLLDTRTNKVGFYMNGLLAVNDRILTLLSSSDDEVFILEKSKIEQPVVSEAVQLSFFDMEEMEAI